MPKLSALAITLAMYLSVITFNKTSNSKAWVAVPRYRLLPPKQDEIMTNSSKQNMTALPLTLAEFRATGANI
jgi:hypothetical protein